ncbi:MAG: phosphoglycerate kinase [Parcubacteria group bacterium Gr01-1014_13]|nr:MAG: phosphoglycerate kinase [Parcubacteria group bacterium Gr01-1014_13]
MRIKSIEQVKNLANKNVLVRVDFNVPVKNGKVLDNYKIKKSLATIKFLVEKRAKVILVSHLGRPEGVDKKLSLKPVAAELGKFLQKNVKLFDVLDLKKTKTQIDKLFPSTVVMLENIRFVKGEPENSEKLAKELAGLAEIFVMDGFAVAHRHAASVTGIAKHLPAYAGLLLEEEIEGLNRSLQSPKKPFVVMLGGVKMETKIPVLKNLLKKANYILVGGGILSTYLWAKGYKVGGSLIDKNFKKEILRYCSKRKVILPVDVIVGTKDGKLARATEIKKLNLKNKELAVYDIGPRTIKLFSRYIKKANTLVWNGAMGYFEQHPYEYGTYSVARLLAARAKGRAFGITGGGETMEVLKKLHLIGDIDMASTGGGSMLEYLSGKKLPGIEVLKR